MIATSITYIESDFASPTETFAEYRTRTAFAPRGHLLGRAYRRLLRLA
jgi:hypothetical protein